MAWYALYKQFIPWRKTPYVNYISWYKQNLYDEWFENLSEEEKKAELDRIQRTKEREKQRIEMAFKTINKIFNMAYSMGNGRYW